MRLQTKLKRLLGNEPRLAERIDVHSLNAIGLRLYKAHVGPATHCQPRGVREADERGRKLPWTATSSACIFSSPNGSRWWMRGSWRTGRRIAMSRASEERRGFRRRSARCLWSIFERVRAELKRRKLITHAELFSSLAAVISKSKNVLFDFAVVDEAQDISVAHLRFFAALGGGRPNALFFAGDLGQRIFQQPFSWKALGVDIRGRSRTLRVNYRTSHQIRTQADRLLGPVVTDVDGNSEDRSDTVSVFNGPPPTICSLKNESEEIKTVGKLDRRTGQGGRASARIRRVCPIRSTTGSCACGRQGSRHSIQGSR